MCADWRATVIVPRKVTGKRAAWIKRLPTPHLRSHGPMNVPRPVSRAPTAAIAATFPAQRMPLRPLRRGPAREERSLAVRHVRMLAHMVRRPELRQAAQTPTDHFPAVAKGPSAENLRQSH